MKVLLATDGTKYGEAAVEMINKHAKPLGRGRKRTRAEQEELDALERPDIQLHLWTNAGCLSLPLFDSWRNYGW